MFECKLNLSLRSLTLEVALNARHVASRPITLSSTCNLMLRGEEGSASLPPGVIYDWGHVNKNIKTIWALLGEIPVRYVHHARQAQAGIRLLRDSMLVRMPRCPVLNRICSCCSITPCDGFWGKGVMGVGQLRQGDIYVRSPLCGIQCLIGESPP